VLPIGNPAANPITSNTTTHVIRVKVFITFTSPAGPQPCSPLSAADKTGIHHAPGRTNNKKYAVYTTLAKMRSGDIACQLTGETAVALPL